MKQQPSNGRPGNAAGAEGARRPAREPAVRAAAVVANDDDALSVLESLAGSIIAPADWATQHDHYLYGTPKRSTDPA
jgi:hypothetical protein